MGKVRTITTKFITWCQDDSAAARFERSVAQGVIAVVIVGVTTGEWGAATATGAVMAVLSPIQKAIGNKDSVDDNERIEE